MTVLALLALEDGSVFHGVSVGASGQVAAEVVFSTAASGYQELLTDPALAGKLLTLTYPVAGSVGVNAEDAESDEVVASGLIIRELSHIVSNWRAEQSLPEYLQQHGKIAIAGIDTRRLTRLIRSKGRMGACIQTGDNIDEAAAIAAAQQVTGPTPWAGSGVSNWQQGIWQWGQDASTAKADGVRVAVVDLGVTRTLLRVLVEAGANVTVVPASSPVEALADYQAVVLSNGPGEAAQSPALGLVADLFAAQKPMFGIGLGMRVMAVAQGAQEEPLTPPHYGGSHPVRAVDDAKVEHTDQRSSYAVVAGSLPSTIAVTHNSLFDQSVQGLKWQNAPAQGFQGVPKGSVSSTNADVLLREFVTALNA